MLANPRFFSGWNLNDVITQAIRYIHEEGIESDSRNGKVKYVNDLTLQLNNPRARHLSIVGRKSNIYQLIAETLWVMSGTDQLDPVLNFFLPRATQYSDDGRTWRGAYGPRMYDHGQLESIYRLFQKEGKTCRRAIVQIASAEKDSLQICELEMGEGCSPRDIPCNQSLHFYITDDELNLKVIQRSGDMLFGAGSINPFEFSYLLEVMYNDLKALFPELKLGVLRWTITNAHLYYSFEEQILDIIANDHVLTAIGDFGVEEYPAKESIDQALYQNILSDLQWLVTSKGGLEDLRSLSAYTLEPTLMDPENITAVYYYLSIAYIIAKNNPEMKLTLVLQSIPDSLLLAIQRSLFTKFELVVDPKPTEAACFTLNEKV